MSFGEPGSTAPDEPPRSWSFDEDESWGTDDSGTAGPTTRAPTDAMATAGPRAGSARDAVPSFETAPAAPVGATPDVTAAHVATPAAAAAGGSAATTVVAHPARMVLGMASLAAERLRGGIPARDALVTGVGLLQETATGLRDFSRRVIKPASRFATVTVDRAVDRASLLPGAAIPATSIANSRARWAKVVTKARNRGRATVAAGRADAESFVRSSVAETLGWAQAQAVPQIVDGLVPHLIDEVVPRILDGAMPEIRAKVLPIVIDDLAESPQLRDLMMEQGRGVVGDAAQHLRSTTATADDRVESAFRRLVRGGSSPDVPTEHDGRTTTDATKPAVEGG